MNGLKRIQNIFKTTKAQGRPALMPYFTLGFPDPVSCLEILKAITENGADLIELGIPFSDPLADGPTIQRSTQAALDQGITVKDCLEMTARLRAAGADQPILLMGYYNPILAFGITRFTAQAAEAGADGFIIPDLPPEEADDLQAACQEHGLALVFMLAPTTTPDRVRQVADKASGFLYLVSLTGVTGARQSLSAHIESLVHRARQATSKPLAVGFGISTPQQAQVVGKWADGVIIGSALISAVDGASDPVLAAQQFILEMRQALEVSAKPT